MANKKQEILAQAEALNQINGNIMELIGIYAEEFRKIITDFEADHNGQTPTAADLLWIASEHHGRDITEG